MNKTPQPGEIYQNFKGNLYRIVTLAKDAENGGTMVIYQALYGDLSIYAEPLAMFAGEVDHDKYPDVQAKYRFTLVPDCGGKLTGNHTAGICRVLKQDEPQTAGPEDVKTSDLEDTEISESEDAQASECVALSETREDESEPDPRLLAFLEADSYEKKLEIYAALAGKADESMLNAIAVSMDLELSGDTPQERYESLKHCLLMLEKYECNRLR